MVKEIQHVITNEKEAGFMLQAAKNLKGVEVSIVSRPGEIYTTDLRYKHKLGEGEVGVEYTTDSFEITQKFQKERNRLRAAANEESTQQLST